MVFLPYPVDFVIVHRGPGFPALGEQTNRILAIKTADIRDRDACPYHVCVRRTELIEYLTDFFKDEMTLDVNISGANDHALSTAVVPDMQMWSSTLVARE